MKEFVGVASNLSIALRESDSVLIGAAELIIVVTEPTHRLSDDGSWSVERKTDALRFGVTVESIDTLIEGLQAIKGGLDHLHNSIQVVNTNYIPEIEPAPNQE